MHGYDVNKAIFPNCKILGLWVKGSGLDVAIYKSYIKYSSLLPQYWEINWMHDQYVYEAFYKNYEIHGPWLMSVFQALRHGQYGPIHEVKIYLILKILLYFHSRGR